MTWKEVIANISFGFIVPEVRVQHTDLPGGEGVVITRRVRHFDTGEWDDVAVTYPLPSILWYTHQVQAAAFIHSHVCMNFCHEVSEHFRFRGERVFDPHRGT